MRPLPLPTTAYLTAGLATLSHVYSSQGEPLPRGRARRKSLLPLRGRAPPCSPGRGPRSDLTLSGSLCEGNAFPLSSHGWARVLVVDTFRPPGGGRAAPRAACLLWVPSTYQCPPSSRARPPASGGLAGGGRAEGVPHSAFWWPRIRPPCPVSASGRPRGLPQGRDPTPHRHPGLADLCSQPACRRCCGAGRDLLRRGRAAVHAGQGHGCARPAADCPGAPGGAGEWALGPGPGGGFYSRFV